MSNYIRATTSATMQRTDLGDETDLIGNGEGSSQEISPFEHERKEIKELLNE